MSTTHEEVHLNQSMWIDDWYVIECARGRPACGALICVESECDFRDAMTPAERDALEARVSVESAVLAQLGGER